MYKLLCANFARLWKNKVFWGEMAAMLTFSIVIMFNGCRQAIADASSGYRYVLDHYYFSMAPMLGLFCAIFTSLYLGTEYADGAIRNKLIVGHGRAGIYLTNLMVSYAATLLFALAWLAGGLVGIPTLGTWQIGYAGLACYVGLIALFALALSAIFTFVGMAFSGKATSAVCSMLLYLGLLVWASMVYNSLCQPEMSSGIIMTAEGMRMSEPSPNPDYIGGNLRNAYEFVLDLLPTGQGILMTNVEIARPLRMGLCSVTITVIMTLCGLILFDKKDLK